MPTQNPHRPIDKGDAISKETSWTSKSSQGKESWGALVYTGLTKILPLAHLFQLSCCPVKCEAGKKLNLACPSVQRRREEKSCSGQAFGIAETSSYQERFLAWMRDAFGGKQLIDRVF